LTKCLTIPTNALFTILVTELARKTQDNVRAENEELRKSSECDVRKLKADTVRKMQERFIAEIEQTPNANEHFIKAWKSKIDQIAKEIMEGENE
jgi:hypothetical protein